MADGFMSRLFKGRVPGRGLFSSLFDFSETEPDEDFVVSEKQRKKDAAKEREKAEKELAEEAERKRRKLEKQDRDSPRTFAERYEDAQERKSEPSTSMERHQDAQERKEPPKSAMDRYRESQERKRQAELDAEVEAFIERQDRLDRDIPRTSMERHRASEERKAERKRDKDRGPVMLSDLDKKVQELDALGRLVPSPPSASGLHRLETKDGELYWALVP